MYSDQKIVSRLFISVKPNSVKTKGSVNVKPGRKSISVTEPLGRSGIKGAVK